LDEVARAEILKLFPQLVEARLDAYGDSARLTLKAYEAQIIARSLRFAERTAS
jgi:hypothetical protein